MLILAMLSGGTLEAQPGAAARNLSRMEAIEHNDGEVVADAMPMPSGAESTTLFLQANALSTAQNDTVDNDQGAGTRPVRGHRLSM